MGPGLIRQHRLIGRPAPELRFNRVSDGAQATLAEHRGKVVLVNLWATWCPPCRHELPELDRLQRSYRDRGLVVLLISDEPREVLAEFLATSPMSTEHGFAAELPLPEAGRPTTFVIDRAGAHGSLRTRAASRGSAEQAQAPPKVAQVLAQELLPEALGIEVPAAATAGERPGDSRRRQQQADDEAGDVQHPGGVVVAAAARQLPGADLRLADPVGLVARRDVVEVVKTHRTRAAVFGNRSGTGPALSSTQRAE